MATRSPRPVTGGLQRGSARGFFANATRSDRPVPARLRNTANGRATARAQRGVRGRTGGGGGS